MTLLLAALAALNTATRGAALLALVLLAGLALVASGRALLAWRAERRRHRPYTPSAYVADDIPDRLAREARAHAHAYKRRTATSARPQRPA